MFKGKNILFFNKNILKSLDSAFIIQINNRCYKRGEVMVNRMEGIQKGLVVSLAILCELLLLMANRILPDGALEKVLEPYVRLCGLFYPVRFLYEEGIGYRCLQQPFMITEACLGNIFMAVVFGVMFFGYMKALSPKETLGWFTISGLSALVLGYVMNSIRILASIPWVGFKYFGMIHLSIGMVLYIGGLIGVNVVIQKVFRGGQYAKIY